MTGDRKILQDIERTSPITVHVANGDAIKSGEKGSVCFKEQGKSILIRDVFFVPGLTSNLLSVGKLIKKGYKVTFKSCEAEIAGPNGSKLCIPKFGGIYVLTGNESGLPAKVANNEDLKELHERFGHVNIRAFQS